MKYKVLIDPQTKNDIKEIYNYVTANEGKLSAKNLLII